MNAFQSVSNVAAEEGAGAGVLWRRRRLEEEERNTLRGCACR